MSDAIPALPEGFTLEEGHPPLPAGFRLEETPAMDVAKSAGSGLANGAVGIPGAAGDAQALLKAHSPFDGLKSGLESLFPNVMKTLEESSAKSKTHHSELGEISLPTSADIKAKTGLDAADYDPQSSAGKFAKSIGAFVPGALVGGVGAGNLVRNALLPGAASEAAGEALEGTKYEGLARAAAGIAAPIAGRAALSPFASEAPAATRAAHAANVEALRQEGVHVTAGQQANSRGLQYVENALHPEGAQEMLEGFTRAATRRAGAETPVLEHGRGGTVDTLLHEVGGRFDRLQANNTLHGDARLGQDLTDLANRFTRIPGAYDQEAVAALHGYADHITDLLRGNGAHPVTNGPFMTGVQYQRLRSSMSDAARSSDGQRSEALHALTDALDDAMERHATDPGEFGRARGDYRRALVLERAAGAAGESPARGYITPAQLASASKAIYGKRAYERGNDPFSSLATPGAAVLKALPDSGTAHRAWVNNTIKGLAHVVGGGGGLVAGGGVGGNHDTALYGLLLGEGLAPAIESGIHRGARAAVMNGPMQAYLGNQVGAGTPRLRDTPQGLLTILQAAQQARP